MCHKNAYRTREYAELACLVLPRHDGCRPYRCPKCGHWHIGHEPKKKPKPQNRHKG